MECLGTGLLREIGDSKKYLTVFFDYGNINTVVNIDQMRSWRNWQTR